MQDITHQFIQKLAKKTHTQNFPDFYQLDQIIENNPWHMNQSVLQHSLASAEKLLNILSSHILPKGFDNHVSKKIDGVTKKELFKIAVLLHDLGKVKTREIQPDGSTWCPGHAATGAKMVRDNTKLFNLTDKQIDYISRIIHFHMVPFEELGKALQTSNTQEYLDQIKKPAEDIYPELLVLAYADMSGCILPEQTIPDFRKRINIIHQALVDFFSSGAKSGNEK